MYRTDRSSLAILSLLSAASLCLAASSCRTPVGVWRLGGDRVFREMTANALNEGEPSQFSVEVLARRNLLEAFDEKPAAVIAELHGTMIADRDRDILFALAELSYLHGRAEEERSHILAAVLYAYSYLFHESASGAAEPYDPRFRLACNLYNRALAEFLRTPLGDARIESGVHDLPTGKLEIAVSRPGFPWSEADFHRFIPAGDFKVRGLSYRHRNAGLGVPLIAVQAPSADGKGLAIGMAAGAKVAATAFLRFRFDQRRTEDGRLHGSLELYSPTNITEVDVGGRAVPLEADFTAPLAYGLQESKLWKFELGGFLEGSTARRQSGLYFIEPYVPGKIPVVFVHGTASSPARWAEMFNSLQVYRPVREHFQFWFYLYPTGNPIPYSASLLRDALLKVTNDLDPRGADPALREMVVIGHSQGGVLSRLVAIDSGTKLWETISDRPFEDLELPQERKDLLRHILFFEHVPAVRRLVFISTPHRGSFLAGRWYSRLAARFITLPKDIIGFGAELVRASEAGTVKKDLGREVPTSLRNMTPGNPFLGTVAAIPFPSGVKCHSIIAAEGDGPLGEANDGVVEYESAHLEGAASEFVVRCGHSCQAHPLTILEVRRILMAHLGESRAPGEAKR